MGESICSRDCFNCEHPDCIRDGMDYQDYKEHREIDIFVNPKTRKQEAKAAYYREWYQKNKEARTAYMRERYQKNREAKLTYKREWYKKNKEAIAAYQAEWYQKNKGSHAAYMREYRKRKKEEEQCRVAQ